MITCHIETIQLIYIAYVYSHYLNFTNMLKFISLSTSYMFMMSCRALCFNDGGKYVLLPNYFLELALEIFHSGSFYNFCISL